MRPSMVSVPRWSRSARIRSLAYTMPTMSSMFSRYTGKRLSPLRMAISTQSATRYSTSKDTMSVRGTMISRATVSPKSMIDSMRSRSSSSMTEASAASPIRAMISSSVTNGPCSRPLPGRITLVTVMSTSAIHRNVRPMSTMSGAVASAARSVCCRAHVFGAASAMMNTTTTLISVATMTPAVPNTRDATMPVMDACTVCSASATR